MRRRYSAKEWLLGLGQFAMWWFGTLVIGFPLILVLFRYTLREGVNLLSAHPRFFIVFCLWPFPIIAFAIAEELLQSWTKKHFEKKNGSIPVTPENPDISN